MMDCRLEISEFELNEGIYVHFRTTSLGQDVNTVIDPSNGLNRITVVLQG